MEKDENRGEQRRREDMRQDKNIGEERRREEKREGYIEEKRIEEVKSNK